MALLQSVAYQERLPQGSPSRPLSSPSEAQVAQVSGLARLGMLGQEDWYCLRVEHSVQKHMRVWKRWPSIGTSCMALQLLGAILILRAQHTWHTALPWPQSTFPVDFSTDSPECAPCMCASVGRGRVYPVCVRLWVGDVCTLYVCVCRWGTCAPCMCASVL